MRESAIDVTGISLATKTTWLGTETDLVELLASVNWIGLAGVLIAGSLQRAKRELQRFEKDASYERPQQSRTGSGRCRIRATVALVLLGPITKQVWV